MDESPKTQFVLTYVLDGVTNEHALDQERLLIGRAKHCDLCFPFNAEISRVHATFAATPEGWVVEDMSSRSGTYVNGEPVREPRRLRDRDVLAIGQIKLTLREKKHSLETITGDREPPAELLKAARPSGSSSVPLDSDSQSEDAPQETAESSARLRPSDSSFQRGKKSYYDLIGVANFESDLSKIHAAAKTRLGQLREDEALGSSTEREAEIEAIADGMASLSNPDRKRAYDTELAQQIGTEVEIRGGRVVPVQQAGLGQMIVGLVFIGVIVVILWLVLTWLFDAMSPFFDFSWY